MSPPDWPPAESDRWDPADEPVDLTAESATDAGLGDELAGKRITLVGKLGGMNRREATNLLRSYGAVVVDLHAEQRDLVVIGAEESPLAEAGLLNESIREAAARGELEVIAETELWHRLGLVDIERAVKRYYTPAMLADLLGVSVRVIRRWHRRGLIVPARMLHRLPFFDFQEVATARRLAELVAAGASPQAIEDRLYELAKVLPQVTRPLAQLTVLVEGRHVLLRQGEGLIEPGGQLRFDFAAADPGHPPGSADAQPASPDIFAFNAAAGPTEPADRRSDNRGATSGQGLNSGSGPAREVASIYAVGPCVPSSTAADDDLLQAMYDAEDEGDLALAIQFCRSILARDGASPDFCFQLGELLYRDGQIEAARERYFCAIELDDSFVEARTSLACVLAETGQTDLAIAALQGVLSLHPDYPDAHYHLATWYEEQGQPELAAAHWERLRQAAPDSPWNQPEVAAEVEPAAGAESPRSESDG